MDDMMTLRPRYDMNNEINYVNNGYNEYESLL
jgi:hypothetical protein